MPAADLDLDRLKRRITATDVGREPDAQTGGPRFLLDFLNHYIRGDAITMLPLVRLDHLQRCIEDVVARGVPGDLLEAGVWRGGAVALMRAVLARQGVTDRTVWAADSFEGLPAPDPQRFPKEAAAHNGPLMRDGFHHLAASLEEVQGNLERLGLLDTQVRFLRGWFCDTLPTAPVERLAVLRLDGDYHDSTLDVLRSLYAKVSPGGYVIVDDYGEDDWTECRRAVDDFRAANAITEPLVQVDRSCWYWQRGNGGHQLSS